MVRGGLECVVTPDIAEQLAAFIRSQVLDFREWQQGEEMVDMLEQIIDRACVPAGA